MKLVLVFIFQLSTHFKDTKRNKLAQFFRHLVLFSFPSNVQLDDQLTRYLSAQIVKKIPSLRCTHDVLINYFTHRLPFSVCVYTFFGAKTQRESCLLAIKIRFSHS